MEDGCLKDAIFNTFQVMSGTLEDAFPSGKGPIKGLSLENGYVVSMGNNRIENVSLPTAETDVATKYYVDSIFNNSSGNTSGNTSNIWNTLNIIEEGGINSSTITSINPSGIDSLTFSAGNNINLSFDTTNEKTLKIEINNNLSVNSLSVDGEGGIKVKNSNSSHGFVEFYENSDNGDNKIKVQGREITEDVIITLPNTTGNLISSGDTETVSSEMLSITGVAAGNYGSSTEIPVITVDSKGRISSASISSISTDLNISSDSGTNTITLGINTLQFTGGNGINTTINDYSVTHSIDNTVVTLTGSQEISNKTFVTPLLGTPSSGNLLNCSGYLTSSLSGTITNDQLAGSIDLTDKVTNTLPIANGGTGQTTYTDGQLLIGNSLGSLSKATLTPGDNITITNGNGGITITSQNTTYSIQDGELSENNFTNALKTKLIGIATNAEVNVQSDWNETNTNSDSFILNKPTIPSGNQIIDWTLSNAGTIDVTNLPSIAITNTQTATNETAHLALTAQQGDIVIRTDESKTYIHNGGNSGTIADYTVLATPTDTVTSVSGKTGAVTLTSGDVGLGNVENVALSTWQGSTNITTVGEINGSKIADTTIDLTSKVTNILPVTNGGTGATSFQSNSLLTGNGEEAINAESNLLFETDTLTIKGSSGKLKIQNSTNGDFNTTISSGSISENTTLTLPTETGTLATTKNTGYHVVSMHYAYTQQIGTNWTSLCGNNLSDFLITLDPSKSPKPRRRLCLCEIFMPKTRPNGNSLNILISNYTGTTLTPTNYWDGVGDYQNTTQPSSVGAVAYEDINSQLPFMWKCLIDLSDYGTNWETNTFKLGIMLKSSSDKFYIYGNTTGQFVWKITELKDNGSDTAQIGGVQR